MQKGHECKATQRPSGPVRLRVGPCRSRKRFRPRSCGNCPGACCRPVLTHTIRVLFACATRRGHPLPSGEGAATEEERPVGGWGGRWLPAPPASLLSLAPPGTDLWERDPGKEEKRNKKMGHYERQKMSSAQVQESLESPSLFHSDSEEASSSSSRSKRMADWLSGGGEEGGTVIWRIKPNLPKETRQPKRRRLDVRRGGRQNGGGRGKRSVARRWGPRTVEGLERVRRGVASHQFDWSHESASEEELVNLSVQWIEKCQCSEIPCPETPAIELEGDGGVEWSAEADDEDDGEYVVSDARGEMILHRVHREMKP